MNDSTALANTLTFTALLDVLGYRSGEFVSILHIGSDAEATVRVERPADAATYTAAVSRSHNVYFGVNPIKRVRNGRGRAGDVTRLAALYADLDVKLDACTDIEHAEDIVAALSEILGVRPSAIVHSGSGLHPYWPIDDGDATAHDIGALLRRWGRLVAAVADRHAASVDNVFDLPRVLRVPGTVNAKNGAVAVAHADAGAPLTIAEVDERLTEFGVLEEDGDTRDDKMISDPATWQPGAQTCGYVTTLIKGIPSERPRNGRHQWAASQAVRLACALRLGCLTQTDYRHAETLIAARLRELRAETDETVPEVEVPALMEYGRQRAAIKSDTDAWNELGGQQHRQSCENRDTMSESLESDDDIPVYADRLLSRSDLLMLPDPQPLIDDVLDQGTVALLYGKWGTAKTFIGLDWAASVATGRNWQGRKTEQRRVLYVVGEGAFGFKARTAAWEMGWQTKIDDESLSILPFPVNLTKPAEVNNLRALIEWGGYSFVILDTLARCMVGADENSAQDGGIVVDAMTRLLASTPDGRGVVLGVHHAGKDGKTLRGSSAFESGADTVYFASRDETLISLTREKRKDGPENDSHLMVFDPMPGTGSGVMSVSRGMSQGGETTERTATLRSIMSQSFRLTGASSTQLRQIAVDDGLMGRTTFYRAITDLLESGWLSNTGTDKRPFYVITGQDG